MEGRRSIFSHLSGIVRLIIFIILVVLLVFFVVRFVRNRQASNRAQQTVRTAEKSQDKNTGAEAKEENNSSSRNSGSSNESSAENGTQQIPSGIADSELGEPGTTVALPGAGMDAGVVLSALTLSLLGYASTRLYESKQVLRECD